MRDIYWLLQNGCKRKHINSKKSIQKLCGLIQRVRIIQNFRVKCISTEFQQYSCQHQRNPFEKLWKPEIVCVQKWNWMLAALLFLYLYFYTYTHIHYDWMIACFRVQSLNEGSENFQSRPLSNVVDITEIKRKIK